MDNTQRKSTTNDGSATKRKRNETETEEKRKERLEANRIAAYKCRLRKQILIDELQKQVADLSKKVGCLQQENDLLKEQVVLTQRQTQQLPPSSNYANAASAHAQDVTTSILYPHHLSTYSTYPTGNCSVGSAASDTSPLTYHQQQPLNLVTMHVDDSNTNPQRASYPSDVPTMSSNLHFALGRHLDDMITRQKMLIRDEKMRSSSSQCSAATAPAAAMVMQQPTLDCSVTTANNNFSFCLSP